jgi:ElaB/YqjD/DUF883 family membrane-anchored ribosome-binding protein
MSCNKNNPKDVAHTWLTGFNQMDFEQAMKLSTNDTKNLLSTLEQLTEGVSDSGRTELKKIKVSIKDVKEDGDKAMVTYTSSDNPNEQVLSLVKQNDKWLVQFTKTDLVGTLPQTTEGEEMSEEVPTTDSAATPADTTQAAK